MKELSQRKINLKMDFSSDAYFLEDLWFTLKLLSFSEIVQIVNNAKRSVIIQNNQTSIYSPFYLNGFTHKEKFLGSFNIH